MVLSRPAGILILEKHSEQQELKDIITSREDGFGHLLKIARVAKNLSASDIARELHLNEKVILALESEDYTQLPESAFVCGYIRNYSRLLNIQPESLIEYYKKEQDEEHREPGLKTSKAVHSRKNSIASIVIIPILMALILAALTFGGWKLWQYVSKNSINIDDFGISTELSEKAASPDAMDEQNNDDPGSLSLPVLDESYDLPRNEETLERDSSSTDEQSETEDILSNETNLSSETELPAEDSLLAEGSLPAEGSALAEGSLPAESSMPAEDALTTDGVLPAETSNENSGNMAAGGGDSQQLSPDITVDENTSLVSDNKLVLVFSGNSWISIKDANNKNLANGLKKAGLVLRLEGKTPYKVFLGDGRMVKVSINGKTFEHTKYINEKNIARFNVK